jgi:hypothetical protein|tara:strand:+ start:9692 stop:9955 length:264 start_codon:yes stop_codon:yes gene_type:complete
MISNNTDMETGMLYAVNKGKYLGDNLVIINRTDDCINFLSLNDMKNRAISKENVVTGIQDNILELLDRLPEDILNTCKQQYEKNTNN